MTQASRSLVDHAGGLDASLNHYSVGGNCWVTTQQVDHYVYVVGQDDFSVSRHGLEEWLGHADQDTEPPVFECDDAEMAWELLRLLRQGCLIWQCGACDAWIFTAHRPQVGVLACSSCGQGGIDFNHAWRHSGGE